MGLVRALAVSYTDANAMHTRARSSVLASIQQVKMSQRVRPTAQSVGVEGRLLRLFAYADLFQLSGERILRQQITASYHFFTRPQLLTSNGHWYPQYYTLYRQIRL